MLRRTALVLLGASGLLPSAAKALPSPFARPPVSDSELDTMRGGFSIGNGVEIAFAVQTTTRVNGATVLLSEFRMGNSQPRLDVFVARTTAARADDAKPATPAPAPAASPIPTVAFALDGNGVVSPPSPDLPQVKFSVSTGPVNLLDEVTELDQVALAPGEAVATPAGLVSLSGDTLKQVRIQSDGLEAVHYFGNAFGSLTANFADDRVIDTTTNISIDLANVSPDALGSTLPRLEGLALDSASMLSRQGGL